MLIIIMYENNNDENNNVLGFQFKIRFKISLGIKFLLFIPKRKICLTSKNPNSDVR